MQPLNYPNLQTGTEDLRTEFDLANNKVQQKRGGPKKGKNPSYPNIKLQVSQCLVRATLSLTPGGLDFSFNGKPAY